jgi:cathepsin A (carboxypeptidase C)
LAWTKELEWYGKKEYNAAEVQDWYSQLSGKYAGQLRSYDKLTFLRVFDAGHMVPYDQPEHALDMFANWLNNSLTN